MTDHSAAPVAEAPASGVDAELVRAASALLSNLWQDVWSHERTHEENWKEFDRKYPGVKWLRDARDATLATPPASEAVIASLKAEIAKRDEWVTHWQTKCAATRALVTAAEAQVATLAAALEAEVRRSDYLRVQRDGLAIWASSASLASQQEG
jgi:hypothetical protein